MIVASYWQLLHIKNGHFDHVIPLNIFFHQGSYNKSINQFLGEGRTVKTKQRFWGLDLKKQLIILGLLGLIFLTGCATTGPSPSPYMYTGAGLGAALGAGIGAAANHNNPWRGAAIGGLLGAAGGGVAGEAYGRSQTPYYPQQAQGNYQPTPQGTYQPQPY